MYSFKSRIRYTEFNSDLKFPVTSLINYFQDCSTFQSEHIGKGIGYLKEQGKVWMIVSWQIHINRMPRFMEDVEVCTWPHKKDKLYAQRNFIMKSLDGEILAYSNSTWVLINTSTLKPMKIEDDDITAYGEEDSYDMEYMSRKISLPDDMQACPEFTVHKANLDNNNHVNNGQYILMAEEFLPSDFEFSVVRADYRKSAVLNDIVKPYISLEDNACTILLADENDKPFTIVQFLK